MIVDKDGNLIEENLSPLERELNNYYIKFSEHFPTMNYQTANDQDIISKIRKCIKNNKRDITKKEVLY